MITKLKALTRARWAKPAGKGLVLLIAALALTLIGRATFAGSASPSAMTMDAAPSSTPHVDVEEAPAPAFVASAVPVDPMPPPTASVLLEAPRAPPPSAVPKGPATPEDPVFLNDAVVEDLQRLPGVGAKRAQAILALRARLGRFRQVEDLMKVRGIGQKMLKRLRPLVRLDRPALPPDAGTD